MSTKQLLRLAAALVFVLAIWGATALARRPDADTARLRFLPRIDTTEIDTVVVTKRDDDTATLIRLGPGRWQVNGYPAAAPSVSELLRGLADTAVTAELIAANPASHAELGVTADSARRLRIVRQGKTVVELLAGGRSATPAGVYVRKASEPETYLIRGSLLDPLTRRADDWYERTIATIPIDSVATIEIERGSRSYQVRRRDSTWTLDSGAPADSAGVANLLARYRILAASGFASPAQADSLNWERPQRHARLLGRAGTPIVSLRLDSIASGVWVRRDSGGPAYLIDPWTAARLTPDETTLRGR
jgi:hypothetical protein